VLFLSSVQWLETGQFDDRDLAALQRHRDRIALGPVPLIAVSRPGASTMYATLSAPAALSTRAIDLYRLGTAYPDGAVSGTVRHLTQRDQPKNSWARASPPFGAAILWSAS
jgi:hypothetical protein